MEPSSELLTMVPCILDFLDLDGMELLASDCITSDIGMDSTVLPHIIKSFIVKDPEVTHTKFDEKVTETELSSFIDMSSNLTSEEFRKHFRLHHTTFTKLLSACKESKNVDESRIGPLQNNLLMALYYLGSQMNLQEMSEIFHSDESNLFKVINSTLDTLHDLIPLFITWPIESNKDKIIDGYERICKFPSVVGVMDSTHIECTEEMESSDPSRIFYINPKGNPSITLLAVCDHEMRFLHCCTGWPGSLDSTSVFHDSDFFQDVAVKYSDYFPDNAHILADKDYPLYKWLVTPFGKENEYLCNHEQEFNFYHSLALDVISKAFLHLKRRFPRLLNLSMKDLACLVKTVLVCCALHNLCLNQGDDVLFTDTDIHEHKLSEISNVDDTRILTDDGILKRQELIKYLVQKSSNSL